MRQKLNDFVEIVQSRSRSGKRDGFTGGGQRNGGFMFISLKPLKERDVSADQVVARLRRKLAKVPGANCFWAVQDIRVGGRQSNAAYQFTLQADDLNDLRRGRRACTRAAGLPQLADVNTDQQVKGLQTTLTIDRETAARMGITPRMIDTTLNLAFGQAQVSRYLFNTQSIPRRDGSGASILAEP